MKLRQLSVVVPRADAERAEAMLALADPLALTFDDAADSPLFEPAPGNMPLWPELIIHALFPAEFDADQLGSVLAEALPAHCTIRTGLIEEAHWRGGLQQDVFVLRVAENLCLVPADFQAQPPAANPVRLNMGLAFGTGRHPTTLLCLQWLAQHPPANLSVCDLGCGSGVLAIAALQLGAREAFAIDTDPQAIAATRANAELNNVGHLVTAGTPEALHPRDADIVVANILAGTLVQSVSLITSMLRAGGQIVLSGVLEQQCDTVERAFALQFESFNTVVLDGWARIAARLR